jgi:hypothetical protein
MRSLRRLPVTLLELLVVIAILALASGIVGVSINKALVDQRFRTEVGTVVDELRLAQDLMLILGTDVRVVFKESANQEGVEFWLEMDKMLPPNIQRELVKRVHKLKTIKGVFFADELLTEVEEGRLDVKFLSNGSVMSRGVMRLASTDSEQPRPNILESYICLPGYPKPIKSSDTKEQADELCNKNDGEFDERLTVDTVQKIPEKVRKKESAQPDTTKSTDTKDEDKDKNKSEKKGKKAEKQAANPLENMK